MQAGTIAQAADHVNAINSASERPGRTQQWHGILGA